MALINQNENQPKQSKYSKLLTNLLEIKRVDTCLFSRTSATSYDLFSKLGGVDASSFLENSEYRLVLKDLDIENLIDELKSIRKSFRNYIQRNISKEYVNDSINSEWDDPKFYGEKVISAYEKFNQTLPSLLRTRLKILHDSEPLDDAITSLEQLKQQSLNRWKRFAKLVDDKHHLTNMWPLYIGSGFLTINFGDGKILNAPLLLKQSKIIINGSTVALESSGDWIVNDKLLYILKRHDLFISEEIKTRDKSFIQVSNEILTYLRIDEKPLSFYVNKFKNLKRDEINNRKIEINPGIILGLFYPSGGYIREMMQKIIDLGEIDEILRIQPNKNIYEDKVQEFLKNNYADLVKIQESSYAQDRALISALQQDTVIWGPPGTGKSQVIANIIANVLYKQKSAIVMSQKRAALDVLRKRLRRLSKFVFFCMYENELPKEEFYSHLKDFIYSIEQARNVDYREKQTLVTPKQVEIINQISAMKLDGKYQASIQTYKNTGGDIQKIKRLANVDPSYHYPISVNDATEFIETTGQLNKVKKNGYIFWWKYPDNFLEKAKTALQTKKDLEIDNLGKMVKPFKVANINEMRFLSQAPDFLKYQYTHSDDEKFVHDFLSTKILNKIEKHFPFENREQFRKYDRFRAAIIAGRRSPHNFVSDHSEVIRALFPVIVTTPSTIFVNWEKEAFDYAIIDEASQMFLEFGLPIMYLSKIKILAGDTEQMRPSSWFSTRDISDDEDEQDNAENAISVLDYALDKGVYQIMLDQNYRSNAASLMSFSSKKFYKSQLEVINNKSHVDERPIEVVNVAGKWNNGTNYEEAEEVVKILKKVGSNYRTIIVLAFNIKQKQLIEDMLIDNEPELWSRVVGDRTITIRNIENIQGDEADLVIASVVYDETTRMSSTYVALAGSGKNALNVAISRAKDKMIVVKSVNSNNISHANSEDFIIFKDWLHFLDLKEEQQRTYSTLQESFQQYGEFESTFEEDVYQKLLQNLKFKNGKSYTIAKQYPVGSKKIDIAILRNDRDFVLGIEVDGYNYHLGMGIDKYLKDYSREEFIKSKGYKLIRISEIKWYLDSLKVVRKIQSLIDNLES